MPKITIVTPTIRADQLEIVERCLKRQTFTDYEWLIIGPIPQANIKEPEKREGDFYNLNKAFNAGFKHAKGDLIVSVVDGIWFPPNVLDMLWAQYQHNPKSCVSCVGHQYDRIENGKPEHLIWRDPRVRSDMGSFYEVEESEMELCLASFPRQAILDIGGFDEEYDRGAAVSEKEAMLRIYKAGYKLYLDQTLEYRAIAHPRIGGSEEWDKHYFIACDMFHKHRQEIANGTRGKLDYLSE